MDATTLRRRLEAAVLPYHLGDWELEEQVEALGELPESAQNRVLDLLGSLWPVSHALAFSFLRRAKDGLAVFGETRLQIWVGAMLDAYESGGLEEARTVLADGGRSFLAQLAGTEGLRFRDVAGLFLPYLCGLAERGLDLEQAAEPSTDTAVVYLPPRVAAFREERRNFLLYKFIAACQWGLIAAGTYRADLPEGHPLPGELMRRYGTAWGGRDAWLEDFFGLFPEPALAQRLYHLAELARVLALIERDLPGLARDAAPVLAALLEARRGAAPAAGRQRLLEEARRGLLGGEVPPMVADAAGLLEGLGRLRAGGGAARDSLLLAAAAYPAVAALPDGEPPSAPLPFEGSLRPAAAEAARRARREVAREQFVEAFAALLAERVPAPRPAGVRPPEPGDAAAVPEDGGAAAVPEEGGAAGERPERTSFLRIGAREIRIPEELQPLVREIREDLGGIPATYVAGVLSRAGGARIDVPGPEAPEAPPIAAPLVYDEWDFRRAGFRKGWCQLHPLELAPGDPAFVARTQRRYRGQILRLRRAFEMLRRGERFVRRQRDGEEIDLDAVVEALGDIAAGRAPSEQLFVRLVRDVRDIAAVFLVDMSSSTEGWVSTAIKESLVLLCEALEILGDRYAIYGFSGMKRLRAELYRIKGIEERFGEAVRGRIAAIGPRDYTRMGPPIRHATELLRATEARIRLLVTLSDGKPEDYDEYKGDYAIEDTRHALIEAKAAGIHPFCITIDRKAHDYIAHMYGEVNYVFIDDVAQLPLRIPQIYRALTA